MILELPFELPLKRCKNCLAFDPYVQRSDYKVNEDFSVECKTRYGCKGEGFCRYREGLKENENE